MGETLLICSRRRRQDLLARAPFFVISEGILSRACFPERTHRRTESMRPRKPQPSMFRGRSLQTISFAPECSTTRADHATPARARGSESVEGMRNTMACYVPFGRRADCTSYSPAIPWISPMRRACWDCQDEMTVRERSVG